MRKHARTITICLIILLISSAACYFLLRNRTQKTDTLTWNDYKSPLGYTLKYPADWNYKLPFPEIVCFGKELEITDKDTSIGPIKCGGDHILVWAQAGSVTNLEETIKIRQEADPKVEFRRFIIDGSNAVTFYGPKTAETFFSSKNGTGYTVSLIVKDIENYSMLQTYYESMLSSFRLTT